MEYEDQEEPTDQMEMTHSHPQPPSYDSLLNNNNSGRPKISTSPVMLESPRKHCRYRECLKNHAIGLGGHAVDGCCEFMPAGADGTLDALKCAACNCHRNFHRKEPSAGTAVGEVINFPSPHGSHHHHHHNLHHPQHFLPYYRTPSGYLHMSSAPPPPRPLALPSTSGGRGSHSQDQEEEDMQNATYTTTNNMNNMSIDSSSLLRKRHRTKFTAEQKDKMMALAERLGWRIQNQDEEAVQHFCEETGVRRHVLKVWMHNNKHTLGKKP